MEETRIAPTEVGQTTLKDKRGGWYSFPFVIGAVMGLSLAAAGWSSNLIVFLINEINMESISATQVNNVILGCNCLLPIFGAILADSFFGSFSVICVSAFISLLGVIMLTLTSTIHSLRPSPCGVGIHACETPSPLQYAILYIALGLASLGLGGTRFTIATMGADQFVNSSNDQQMFFNWYFFTFYLANFLSFTAIIYIQDNLSWGLGFGVCIIANAIGLALLLSGKRFYTEISYRLKGSPFTSIACVVVAAIRKRKISSKKFLNQDFYHGDNNQGEVPALTKSLRFLNKAAIKIGDDSQSEGSHIRSWKLCTVEEVEDLKTLIKIIPLWSTGILLNVIIAMFNSLTILQALTMDRRLSSHFRIPPGSFLGINIVAAVFSIFIIDRFLLPAWKNLTGQSLTPLQRVGVGHIINILAMIGSAIIESRRLHLVRTHHLSGEPGAVVPMSGLWLVLPLTILGFAEGFHFPGQIALYYQEFPKSLRSTSTAMISLLIGIGYYLSTAITSLVRQSTKWLPDNINDGRLDYVFWMLAVIGVVNLGYYLLCAKLFKYKHVQDHDGNEASTLLH